MASNKKFPVRRYGASAGTITEMRGKLRRATSEADVREFNRILAETRDYQQAKAYAQSRIRVAREENPTLLIRPARKRKEREEPAEIEDLGYDIYIPSPVTGWVLSYFCRPGDILEPGDRIAYLANDAGLVTLQCDHERVYVLDIVAPTGSPVDRGDPLIRIHTTGGDDDGLTDFFQGSAGGV